MQDQELFLKQFLGRDGVVRRSLLEAEITGARVASRSFPEFVALPPLAGSNPEMVLLGYARLEFMPLDVALRDDRDVFERAWPSICDQVLRIVERSTDCAATRDTDLLVKERSYEYSALAINFKGLEVRNLAVPRWPLEDVDHARLVAFDLGLPYVGPVEEVAARLLVSTLLLNWGAPLSRFVQGPPAELADVLAERLDPFLRSHPVISELAREERARQTVSRFGSSLERAGKVAAMGTLGASYFRRARRWCCARGLG